MLPPRQLKLPITATLHNKRIDTLLRRELHLSGTAVRRAKRLPDGILLDGKPAYSNVLVREGQLLSVRIGDPEKAEGVLPEAGALCIVYEDQDLLIVDKPAPLAVHPSPTHYGGTLANFVLHHYQSSGLIADFHPVSRLDRGTSGLMTIAKHAHAHERLAADLHTADSERSYLAICEGAPSPPSGLIDAPIARVPGETLQRAVLPEGAAARTQYSILSQGAGRSLLRLRLETGRTHQIRVHLSHLGCPLVGDFLYGQECPSLPDRFALHAHSLRLRQPITREVLELSSPLPAALSALLDDKGVNP